MIPLTIYDLSAPNSSFTVFYEIMNLDPVNISSLPPGKMLSFFSRGCWRDPGEGRRVSLPGYGVLL